MLFAYLKLNTPVYFGIVISLFFCNSTFILRSFNLSNVPSVLFKFANVSGNPIAFITKGEPIFSSFMFITFPPHIIDVVGTTLSLFIDIASAPAFFNSFTMFNISLSCTRKLLESIKVLASTSLSFTVIVTPGPLTSDNPKILFPTFICSCASDNSELFSVAF